MTERFWSSTRYNWRRLVISAKIIQIINPCLKEIQKLNLVKILEGGAGGRCNITKKEYFDIKKNFFGNFLSNSFSWFFYSFFFFFTFQEKAQLFSMEISILASLFLTFNKHFWDWQTLTSPNKLSILLMFSFVFIFAKKLFNERNCQLYLLFKCIL